MEKEKVDKAALGYDYKGETEKHESQKGQLLTIVTTAVFVKVKDHVHIKLTFDLHVQTMPRALGDAMESRQTAWIK